MKRLRWGLVGSEVRLILFSLSILDIYYVALPWIKAEIERRICLTLDCIRYRLYLGMGGSPSLIQTFIGILWVLEPFGVKLAEML